HQQEGRRAGTENVPGVLSMIAALEDRESAIAAGGHGRREAWRDQFVAEMLRSLCGSRLVGEGGPRLWNTVSLVMPEFDCRQRWVVRVDKAGFAVSTGSACASGSEEPSHVLLAMGFQPAEAGRVLRFSSGWETAEADWQQLAAALCGIHETWKSSPKTNAMTTP
ncbi:MAG TPA: cysteine desulfurase NifS, partial [Verrucomicrobiales bacterium]|nr:cysteine desulfurase NifS [Verrucomicrobiales bacterium]